MKENLDKIYMNTLAILNNGMKEFNTSKEKVEENSNMRLYCIYKGLNILCFDSMDELLDYCSSNGLSSNVRFTIEYIGDFKGKHDVIKETLENNELYFSRSEEKGKYNVYCEERSKIAGKAIWQSVYGSIDDMYMEFEKRGIEFHNNLGSSKVKKIRFNIY